MPAGIDVDVYDGTGDVLASADDVELWVPPYIGADPIVRRVIGSLPRLRVATADRRCRERAQVRP